METLGKSSGLLSRREWLGITTGLVAYARESGSRTERRGTGVGAIVVYRKVDCSCCKSWARDVREHGWAVTEFDVADAQAIRARTGVPSAVASCHTAISAGYVFEGHVPEPLIRRVLAERPPIRGLAVPGMPDGTPGMGAVAKAGRTVDVLAFRRDGTTYVFHKWPLRASG